METARLVATLCAGRSARMRPRCWPACAPRAGHAGERLPNAGAATLGKISCRALERWDKHAAIILGFRACTPPLPAALPVAALLLVVLYRGTPIRRPSRSASTRSTWRSRLLQTPTAPAPSNRPMPASRHPLRLARVSRARRGRQRLPPSPAMPRPGRGAAGRSRHEHPARACASSPGRRHHPPRKRPSPPARPESRIGWGRRLRPALQPRHRWHSPRRREEHTTHVCGRRASDHAGSQKTHGGATRGRPSPRSRVRQGHGCR